MGNFVSCRPILIYTNNMMQRTFSIIFILTLGLFFFACGGGGSESAEGSEESREAAAPAELSEELQASIQRGEAVYTGVGICVTCHQADGKGQENLFPPLAESDYLMGDRDRAILQILNGAVGEMVVNGVTYNGAMPAMGMTLSDEQVADVLNYVTNSWGNENTQMFTPEDVAAKRE